MKLIADMTLEERGLVIRQYRRMVRNIVAHIPVTDQAEMVRASGLAICEHCGLELYEHPERPEDTLRIGCDGRLYKL